MERDPQSAKLPVSSEMKVFDFRVSVAYYDYQQELEYNLINPQLHAERQVRTLDDLSVERGVRETCAKLGNKALHARNAALRYREHDPDARLGGPYRWAAHHYNYLAADILLEHEKLDYQALNQALVEEGFELDIIEEAQEQFEHFLLTEF